MTYGGLPELHAPPIRMTLRIERNRIVSAAARAVIETKIQTAERTTRAGDGPSASPIDAKATSRRRELSLLDLPHLVPRKRADEADIPGAFVRCEQRRHVVLELGRGRGRSRRRRAKHHPGHDPLPQ